MPRVYLDLDGVCCDWVGAVRAWFPDVDFTGWHVGDYSHMQTCIEAQKGSNGLDVLKSDQFWELVDFYEGFYEFLNTLNEMAAVYIVTDPGDMAWASYFKTQMCVGLENRISGYFLTSDKILLNDGESVLIEDNQEIWEAWTGPKILVPQRWNELANLKVTNHFDFIIGKLHAILELSAKHF